MYRYFWYSILGTLKVQKIKHLFLQNLHEFVFLFRYDPVFTRGVANTLFLSIPSDLNSIVIPPTKHIMSLIRFYWIADNYFSSTVRLQDLNVTKLWMRFYVHTFIEQLLIGQRVQFWVNVILINVDGHWEGHWEGNLEGHLVIWFKVDKVEV